jgi:hypothetical protein
MPQLEQQKNGWRAHALEGGIVSVEPFGEFVRVPWRQNRYLLSNGSHLIGAAAAENADGSNQVIAVSVNAGLPLGSPAFCTFGPFRGAYVGVRFDPAQVSGGFYRDFDVIVDGHPYRVKKRSNLLKWDGTTYSPGTNGEYGAIVGPFPDRPDHIGEIVVAGDASGNNFNNFYGLLLERRAGYEPLLPGAYATTPQAVPTSSTAVVLTSQGTARIGRGPRSIVYTNTTGAPLQVTLTHTGASPTMAEITIPAHHYDVFDPKTLVIYDTSPTNTLKHFASGAGVNFTCNMMAH